MNATKQEAIATADAWTNNADLPTYSEMRAALGALYASIAHGPHTRSHEVKKAASEAGDILSRFQD